MNGIAGHALVLGGSGGLGAEIVRTLAASGGSAVSFTYGRNKKAADDLVAELRADGIKAFAAPANLSDKPGFNKVLDPLRRGRSPPSDQDREGDGSLGLGLFISREIAIAHGGDIDVESDESETVFTVRLPRASVHHRQNLMDH